MILTYKLSFYFGLSHFFSGVVAEEAKKRGQAVCFYQAAVDRLAEAWKNAEKISSDRTAMFKDVHQFSSDVLNGKFRGTKRDNDSVYFEKVPTLASLPAVQAVSVAKSQFFDCHDAKISGVDIFQKLIPLVKVRRGRDEEKFDSSFLGRASRRFGVQRRKGEVVTRNRRIDREQKSRIGVRSENISVGSRRKRFRLELFFVVSNWIAFRSTTNTCVFLVICSIVVPQRPFDRR